MERRYMVLRAISAIYRYGGIFLLVMTIPAAVLAALAPSYLLYRETGEFLVDLATVGIGVGVMIGGLLLSVSVIATGQFLQLWIDLEENTRTSNLLLRKLAQGSPNGNGSREFDSQRWPVPVEYSQT